MAKAETTAAAPAKAKARRVIKPKDVFMLFEGAAPSNVSFTKDPLEVLEACQGDNAKSYIKVSLPAPKPRAKSA